MASQSSKLIFFRDFALYFLEFLFNQRFHGGDVIYQVFPDGFDQGQLSVFIALLRVLVQNLFWSSCRADRLSLRSGSSLGCTNALLY